MTNFKGMFWTWLDWKAKESGMSDWQRALIRWLDRKLMLQLIRDKRKAILQESSSEEIQAAIESWTPELKQRK